MSGPPRGREALPVYAQPSSSALPPLLDEDGHPGRLPIELIDEGGDAGPDVGLPPEKLTLGIREDGRIDVDCHAPLGRRLSRLLDKDDRRNQLKKEHSPPPPYSDLEDEAPSPPRLNVVIQVAGSRGDVQPFVALGCALKQDHGHRVRIATHAVFEDFVRSAGLEFYPLGGDPTELMAYIVKNPGLIPSFASLKAGDIGRKREMLEEMLYGSWISCIEKDLKTGDPFVADAIIANPPSFGHVHCAQTLRVPLHIMFTMPWTTTRAFSHPLANLGVSADTNVGVANLISYGVVEWLTWQGVGDIVNRWRTKVLDLEAVPESEGPRLLETLKVPHTYCWSPTLVPKPPDWASHIDVCGFFFREPPDYHPPADLAKFLSAGDMPVYVGFGSIVIEDPKGLTELILQAVRNLGARAIISRGWSNLGEGHESDDSVFFLGECPHEWLFTRVSAVVHHGGAGTTACGLLNGVPTFIVPFFGDQPFWGEMVATNSVGPPPIRHGALTVENLTDSMAFCLEPKTKSAADVVASKMRIERGVQGAVRSFHKHLPCETYCHLVPQESAAWTYRKHMRLSKRAASTLIKTCTIRPDSLVSFEPKRITIEPRRWDPVSAVLSASFQTAGTFAQAATRILSEPYGTYKSSKAREPAEQQSKMKTPEMTQNARAEIGTANALNEDTPTSSRAGSEAIDSKDSTPITERSTSLPPPAKDGSSDKAARQIAATSARSAGRLVLSPIKGLLVDVPLAATEGMRALPRLYGDRGYQRDAITDWKSGSNIAAKSFASGITEGVTDIFKLTYARKRKEGAKGVAKGLSMGLVNFTMKTGSGALGLVAYPCRGLYMSAYDALHTKTVKLVDKAKLEEGEWLVGVKGENGLGEEELMRRFTVKCRQLGLGGRS